MTGPEGLGWGRRRQRRFRAGAGVFPDLDKEGLLWLVLTLPTSRAWNRAPRMPGWG
jgi:hypothetical protein